MGVMARKSRNTQAASNLHLKDEDPLIQAHILRTSNINARLLATLDALDEATSLHKQELDEEVRHRERLDTKLRGLARKVKQLEQERDDLRSAVLMLIEKVENSNGDFTLWPRSRMQVSSLLDPLAPSQLSPDSSSGDLLDHAIGLITSLRRERDLERKAHDRTRHSDNARISTLEAQLARREAELEECIAHTGECSGRPSKLPHQKKTGGELAVMTLDETIRVSDLAEVRNRTLEEELKQLQGVASTLKSKSAGPSSASLPQHDQYRSEAGPSSVPLPAPKKRHGKPKAASPAEVPEHLPSSIIGELNQEIETLGAQLEAFVLERDKLTQYIASERLLQEPTNTFEPEDRRPGLSSEGEPEPEPFTNKSVDPKIRKDLEAIRKATLASEHTIMQENTRLLQQITPKPRPSSSHASLIEAYDGELSMELATPLTPTKSLPSSGSRSPEERGSTSPYIDAPSIPLPPSRLPSPLSPASQPSPLNLSPPLQGLPPSNSSPDPLPVPNVESTTIRMEQIQTELEAARTRLNEGEDAWAHLRQAFDDVHLQSP